jgi:hypothetical protein
MHVSGDGYMRGEPCAATSPHQPFKLPSLRSLDKATTNGKTMVAPELRGQVIAVYKGEGSLYHQKNPAILQWHPHRWGPNRVMLTWTWNRAPFSRPRVPPRLSMVSRSASSRIFETITCHRRGGDSKGYCPRWVREERWAPISGYFIS